MYTYYKTPNDKTPKTVTLKTVLEHMSESDVLDFIASAITLVNALDTDDGEYRAIATRKIRALESKISEFSHALTE